MKIEVNNVSGMLQMIMELKEENKRLKDILKAANIEYNKETK